MLAQKKNKMTPNRVRVTEYSSYLKDRRAMIQQFAFATANENIKEVFPLVRCLFLFSSPQDCPVTKPLCR